MRTTFAANPRRGVENLAIYRVVVVLGALSCIHCGRTDISSCEPPTLVPFRRLVEGSSCYSSERYGGVWVTTVDEAKAVCSGETILDVDFDSEFVIGYRTGPGYSGCSNRIPMIDRIGTSGCMVEVHVHHPPSMQLGPCNALIDDVSDFVAVPRDGLVDLSIEFNSP